MNISFEGAVETLRVSEYSTTQIETIGVKGWHYSLRKGQIGDIVQISLAL